MIGRLLSRFVLCFSVFLAAAPGAATALEQFQRSALTVETAAGQRFRFNVELAQSPAQQAQGLMFRDKMEADAGMLFVYGQVQPAAFWMKNTLIPLDMLFVAADGRIVNIHERAVPHSTDSIRSAAPVKAILEINGGMSARLGIRAGDRVVHPLIAGAK